MIRLNISVSYLAIRIHLVFNNQHVIPNKKDAPIVHNYHHIYLEFLVYLWIDY